MSTNNPLPWVTEAEPSGPGHLLLPKKGHFVIFALKIGYRNSITQREYRRKR